MPLQARKPCTKCKKTKPLGEFYDAKSPDGKTWYCKTCLCAYYKQWRIANPERRRGYERKAHARKKYGLSLDDYENYFEDGCAICGGKERLGLDHDHSSGDIRAVLCARCNTGLGQFKDDPDLMRAAAEYVETHTHAAPSS